MTPPGNPLAIRGTRLVKPKGISDALAAEAARQVSERIDSIEAEAGRVDTQSYAIQAAFEYAIALQQHKAEAEADNAELLRALDALQSKLAALVEKHGIDLD